MTPDHQIEIRTDFYGTGDQASRHAQHLANLCEGEVTATFDEHFEEL
ncbi:hypothetical protein ACIBEK_24175 [Nocardia fusca]